jgi:hypothetical protein
MKIEIASLEYKLFDSRRERKAISIWREHVRLGMDIPPIKVRAKSDGRYVILPGGGEVAVEAVKQLGLSTSIECVVV